MVLMARRPGGVMQPGDKMAEQIGKVRNAERQGWAVVVTDRKGACGGCRPGPQACGSCLSSAKIESSVLNPVGARAGDIVRLSLPSADLFKGAALFYLAPVLALVSGALAGSLLAEELGWRDSVGAVIGGLTGLGTGFLVRVRLGRGRRLTRQLTPVITAILSTSGGPAGRASGDGGG